VIRFEKNQNLASKTHLISYGYAFNIYADNKVALWFGAMSRKWTSLIRYKLPRNATIDIDWLDRK